MYRSIATINADVAQAEFGARGQGIVWAVIGSGVDAAHPHFAAHQNLVLPDGLAHWDLSKLPSDRRARRKGVKLGDFQPLTVASDSQGSGTSVATLVAGESTDGRGQLLRGMAPLCKILSINIFGEEMSELHVLAALQAIQEMNEGGAHTRIHGVLLPLELTRDEVNYACGYSPVCVEVDRLVSSGVVVVVPAGNKAYDQTLKQSIEVSITDPGNAPNAVTVGSTHRSRPHEYGPSFFSARGPTADGRLKPDLLAPGEKITTLVRSELARERDCATRVQDGTAYAAAHVSGAVAALLSVRPELIGRPLEVKDLLMRTAVDLKRERIYQGAGLVDVVAAIRGARPVAETEARRPAAVKVFCSYSHYDLPLWQEFKTHLSPMQRTGLIEVWSDQAIPAGTEWEPQIYERLEKADVVLLLVSSFFTASDYCYSKEMSRALERHREGTARVVPILVRPVDVDGTPIAALQMLPSKDRPVSTSFKDPHEGWAAVAVKLREVVMELRGA